MIFSRILKLKIFQVVKTYNYANYYIILIVVYKTINYSKYDHKCHD